MSCTEGSDWHLDPYQEWSPATPASSRERTMERRLEIADLLRRRVKLGIHAGSLTPGDRLPSTRELASDFAVDHRVVVAAYHQLVDEGLVEMRPRGGIYVANISPGVIDALRRATETVRLRAVVLHAIADQRTGMCQELEEDYGFEATGLSTDMLGNGHRPSELGQADLIVSTPAYEPLARRLAVQHEKACIIAADQIGAYVG